MESLNKEGRLFSDEVEGWILLLEAWMWLWRRVAATSSLSDEGSKSVGVSDDGRLLDGT